MKYSFAIMTASLAAAVLAHPLDARGDQHCNVASFATTNNNIKPISKPYATTADACLKACKAETSCESIVFGLTEKANSPSCQLFDVPASQVPSQGSQLYVFDKGCSEKAVPNTKPTHSAPRGKVNGNGQKSQRDLNDHQKPQHPPKPVPTEGPKDPKDPKAQQQPRDVKDHQQPHQSPKPAPTKAPKQPKAQKEPRNVDDHERPRQHKQPPKSAPTKAPKNSKGQQQTRDLSHEKPQQAPKPVPTKALKAPKHPHSQ